MKVRWQVFHRGTGLQVRRVLVALWLVGQVLWLGLLLMPLLPMLVQDLVSIGLVVLL